MDLEELLPEETKFSKKRNAISIVEMYIEDLKKSIPVFEADVSKDTKGLSDWGLRFTKRQIKQAEETLVWLKRRKNDYKD